MAVALNNTYSINKDKNLYAGSNPRIAHVFIESGQSNSQGRGALVDSPIANNTLIGGIKTWRRNVGGTMYLGVGSWLGLEYENNQYESRNEFGSILKFAIHLRDNLESTKNHIYMIKADANGKDIDGWLVGGDDENERIAMFDGHITPALADLNSNVAYDEVIVHGFFFDQGQADSGTVAKSNAYYDNLTQLKLDVRNFLGLPQLPFIITRMEGDYTYQAVTAAAQQAVVDEDPNAYMIVGPWTYMDANIHMDGVSQNQIGDDRYNIMNTATGGFIYA